MKKLVNFLCVIGELYRKYEMQIMMLTEDGFNKNAYLINFVSTLS